MHVRGNAYIWPVYYEGDLVTFKDKVGEVTRSVFYETKFADHLVRLNINGKIRWAFEDELELVEDHMAKLEQEATEKRREEHRRERNYE